MPETTAAVSNPATNVRPVRTPDLASIIARFTTPQGFVDPEFPPTVAKPSRWLTDFYGLQAIKDVSREQLTSDFVPKLGEKIAEDAESVTITMPGGYTARFFPVSSLLLAGFTVPLSHVEISGANWREIGANLDNFKSTMNQSGLTDAYLIPNPSYRDEETTYAQLNTGTFAEIKVDPTLAQFAATEDGILLIGEAVHGKPADVTRVMEIVRSKKVDWLGLEMIDRSKQADVDAFNKAAAGTPEYTAARAKLVSYFADAWNGRAGPKTTGEENLYFKLAEAAHTNGVTIIALEEASMKFLFFRYGETSFGAAVRSLWWANHTPKTGRGIVFGGKAHFNEKKPVSYQDLIGSRQPKRKFFSEHPLPKRTS